MKRAFLIAVVTLLPALAGAASKVPVCEKQAEGFPQGSLLPGLKALPPKVYVARKATYWAESKGRQVQMQGEQSFINGESRIVCASTESGKSESFSIYAPTLIDLTGTRNIGDSYWQFHMIANSKEFGIWNQKSRLFPAGRDLEEGLSKIASQIQVYQISRDEYEIVLIRENDQVTENLAIRFDSYSKIP